MEHPVQLKGLVLVCLLLITATTIPAETVTTSYSFAWKNNPQMLLLETFIPLDTGDNNNIVSTTYSVEPTLVYKRDGKNFAHFSIDPSSLSQKEYTIKITYEIQNNPAGHQSKSLPSPESEEFIQSQPFIESDDELIISLAKSLYSPNTETCLKNIFEYIQKSITYVLPELDKHNGAVYTIQTKKGTCSSFTEAFMAIARACRIPCRFSSGIAYIPSLGKGEPHAWLEAYIPKRGWVIIDPTLGDFLASNIKYITCSHDNSDEIFGVNHAGWRAPDDPSAIMEFKVIYDGS